MREAFLLRLIDNNNICKLKDVFIKDNNLYMIFPIYQKLSSVDEKYPDMIVDDKENIKKDILSAIEYLKNINIFQGDIQNRNILYDSENNNYILNDFDCAAFNYGGFIDESYDFDIYMLELQLLNTEQRDIIHDDKHINNPIIKDFLQCKRKYIEKDRGPKLEKVNFYWNVEYINGNRFSRVYNIIEKNFEYIKNITDCDEKIIKLLLCFIFGPITHFDEEKDIPLKLMESIFNIPEEIIYNEIIKLCLLLDFKLPFY